MRPAEQPVAEALLKSRTLSHDDISAIEPLLVRSFGMGGW
jgi:hypothetical protein